MYLLELIRVHVHVIKNTSTSLYEFVNILILEYSNTTTVMSSEEPNEQGQDDAIERRPPRSRGRQGRTDSTNNNRGSNNNNNNQHGGRGNGATGVGGSGRHRSFVARRFLATGQDDDDDDLDPDRLDLEDDHDTSGMMASDLISQASSRSGVVVTSSNFFDKGDKYHVDQSVNLMDAGAAAYEGGGAGAGRGGRNKKHARPRMKKGGYQASMGTFGWLVTIRCTEEQGSFSI